MSNSPKPAETPGLTIDEVQKTGGGVTIHATYRGFQFHFEHINEEEGRAFARRFALDTLKPIITPERK